MLSTPKNWKRHRKLSDHDNLNLPVPRLEIRYSPHGGELAALYSLVYEHLEGEILQIPLALTMCSGSCLEKPNYLDLPFRQGAQIMHDMWTMRLPGYVINGIYNKAIALDLGAMPMGLAKKFRRMEP